MAAMAALVDRLRRMTAVDLGDTTWHYAVLAEYIERYPVADADGNEPNESDWAASYDMHAAAADVWLERAALASQDFDFAADGGNYSRSQVYQQYMKNAGFHASRRNIDTIETKPWPTPRLSFRDSWQGNQPEPEVWP